MCYLEKVILKMDIVIHLFFNKPVTDTTCILGNCSGMMLFINTQTEGTDWRIHIFFICIFQ